MWIKISKVGKQKVGIWWVQKRFQKYGVPIWSLWPNIRFLPSTVAEKNATKNILDGWKDGQMNRGKTVYPPPPSGSGGIKTKLRIFCYRKLYRHSLRTVGDSLKEHNCHTPFYLSVIIYYFLYHKCLYTYYPSCSLSDLCLYDTGDNFI